MYWQFFLGRCLQAMAGVGALLTCVDWWRFGGAGVRVGRVTGWALVAGVLAGSIATYRLRRSGCPR